MDCWQPAAAFAYARNLRPLLRESFEGDDAIDLSNVEMSHYRLSKLRQHDLQLGEQDQAGYELKGGEAAGSAKAKDKKEEPLSLSITRLNELFITDELTEKDLVNYAYTIRDKVRENENVMRQIANNTDEQAMLGDFPQAIDDAIMDSSDAQPNQKFQLLSDPHRSKRFVKLIFDLLKLAG